MKFKAQKEQSRLLGVLPKSSERFKVEGKYVLTRLEPTKPQPSRVRFEKRNGYTVGISDQPVSEQAIRDALDEFPCLRTWRQSTGSSSALSTGGLTMATKLGWTARSGGFLQ